MGARHQLFYAPPQPSQVHSPGPLREHARSTKVEPAFMAVLHPPSLPQTGYSYSFGKLICSLPPSLPHIPPPHTRHVHPQKQRAVRCVGARVCIYSDDCVLLLVVHPAIEPFTTRNSVPSVKRCGVCKLPRLLPASYHQISSGSMMRFSPVLTLGPALMSIKFKTWMG